VTGTHSISRSVAAIRPLTPAQMRRAGDLVMAECRLPGATGAATAPAPSRALVAAGNGGVVDLYVVGGQTIVCVSGDIGPNAIGPSPPPQAPSDTSISLAGPASADDHGHEATIEFGRVGARVHALTFVLTGGSAVPATVRGGFFVVWWPSSASPTKARLATTSGLKSLALASEAASPAASCPADKSCFAISGTAEPVAGKYFAVGGGTVSITAGGSHGSAPGPPQTWIGTGLRSVKEPTNVAIGQTGG
jgi:hypothetical protein